MTVQNRVAPAEPGDPGFVAPDPDPPLTDDTVPYLPRGVRLAHDRVRDMRVLLAPERAIQLVAIGDAILSALDGRTLGRIVADLAAAYGAPRDQIDADVRAFLQGLIDRRMVFVRLP
ncbi:pyrroloquinoline quinone biosynthesis peptide chaperone PqqD [Paracoccus sp. S-4012]|uniref:pyrroloquinoline quinone biosynthesis peptide chaperone PqqD n=1 Tax=Paracoccus sp. S-4012 TaxID=2665648 RepID=UPI0012B0AF8F|nr:pyrroloquinoline quinone biosynthesis peptide chaperone PqqD [Paracoccus sp. S-4012]MRX51685.1 pyrroloquinoline quinone biosynthesis peptide chaperone PqqD [Paracoccus sp. S-4012]